MRRMGREYQGEGHGAGLYFIRVSKWITFGYQPLYDFNVKKISFDINKLNVYSFSTGNTSTDTMALN